MRFNLSLRIPTGSGSDSSKKKKIVGLIEGTKRLHRAGLYERNYLFPMQ
jgi:hypothetical protein